MSFFSKKKYHSTENLSKALVLFYRRTDIMCETLKMLKLNSLQSFFTYFYWLGLGPFILFNEPKKKRHFFISYIPRIICIVFVILFNVHDIFYSTFNGKNFKLDLSICVAIFENIFISNLFHATWQAMCLTIENVEYLLQIKYPLVEIRS